MEFWVTLIVSDLGRDPENGSRIFEAIESLGLDRDPVIDQNLQDGRLGITLSVGAADAAEAVDRARPLLGTAVEQAGLPMTRLVGVEVRDALAEPTAPAA